jgi:hypothetical protein
LTNALLPSIPQPPRSSLKTPCTVLQQRTRQYANALLDGNSPLHEGMPFQEFDGIANGQDRFRGIVGNLETKFLFKLDRQFDQVQAVGAKIVNKARAIDHVVRINNKLFDHDRLGAFGNVFR